MNTNKRNMIASTKRAEAEARELIKNGTYHKASFLSDRVKFYSRNGRHVFTIWINKEADKKDI